MESVDLMAVDKTAVAASNSDQEAIDLFVTKVGARVRVARKERGISRRVLSERSGVSQRYLALLENGGGNISIALLYKVAGALEYPLEWFLVAAKECGGSNLQQRFDAADSKTRQQVLSLLDKNNTITNKQRRVCLIGLRGAGKSTLGRSVSELLNLPFIELNREIEQLSGLSVAEVMNLYGQEGYRKLERQALQRVFQSIDSAVLAVAGGIVSEPDTYELLLSNFHTVWLKASPEEHMHRVLQQGDDRPMAGNPAAMEELKSILVSREALYARADTMIDTSGKSFQEAQAELLEVASRV